jgi:hypothetical protein
MTTAKVLAFDDHPKRHTTVCKMASGETTPAQRAAMQSAVWVLAMQAARMAAKDNFRRQGRRLCDVDANEITAAAKALFDSRPDAFVARAKETVDLWAKQGRWGPRGGFRSR